MSIPSSLARLNAYMDRNRTYCALLEIAIIAWVLYVFKVLDLLYIPGVTPHVSNLIGSMLLTILLIGPASFRFPVLHKKRIIAAVVFVVAINITLEIFNAVEYIALPLFYWENFNTPDHIDAVYGVLGVTAVSVVLIFSSRRSNRT